MNAIKEKLSPEESFWGWKLLIIACILSLIFMIIFYLALTNEPEYMPSHQHKYTQQHVYKSSPTMKELPAKDSDVSDQHQVDHH